MGRATDQLEELHQIVAFPQLPSDLDNIAGDQERLSLLHKSYEEWINSGLGMVEPIFYGGEGAYDFQYLEMASKTYAADEQWIQNHTGDNLDTFIEISKCITQLALERLREFIPAWHQKKSARRYSPKCLSD